MLRHIHHVTMQVADLATAIIRYGTYGLVCHRHTSFSAWLLSPTAAVHVIQAAPPYRTAPTWADIGLSHMCIQTPDSHAWLSNVNHTNAYPRSGPVDLGTGHWYTYVDDPDGITVECEGVPYAPAWYTPWLAHVAFSTADLVRLTTFYARVTGGTTQIGNILTGLPAVDEIAGLAGIHTQPAWVHGCTIGLEFWHYTFPHPQIVPDKNRHACGYTGLTFISDDLGADGTRIAAAGGVFLSATTTSSSWSDPDGNQITLCAADDPTISALPAPLDPERPRRVAALWRPMQQKEPS